VRGDACWKREKSLVFSSDLMPLPVSVTVNQIKYVSGPVHSASDSRTVSLKVCGNAKSMVEDRLPSEGRFFEEPIVIATRRFG